jgi:aquaporin Z
MKAQAVIAEVLGTFFFLSVILSVVADGATNPFAAALGPIAIAVGLLAAIYFGGKISGGHFNPAVSITMLAKGNIDAVTAVSYIVAQIIGGLSALLVNSYLFL